MATIELKPGASAPSPVVPTETLAPVADEPQSTSLITMGSASGIEGETDADDFVVPWLSLCQKSGVLSNTFEPGSFVYNKAIQMGDKKDAEVRVIFHKARKYYEEKLPRNSKEIPRRWSQKAEIPPGVEQYDAAEFVLLVHLPQPVSSGLAIEHEGETWAVAKFGVRRSSYGIFRTVNTDMNGFLKRGLYTGIYRMGRDLVTRESESWYAPYIKADGPTPAELVSAIQDKLGI